MLTCAMNRKVPVFVFASLATAFVGGCDSSPQMRRIDRNRDIYETWPIDTRQAVLDGKVEAGMTPEMVRVAWGEPTKVVAQGSAGDEIWVYEKGGSEGSVYYPSGMGGINMGSPGIGVTTGRGGTSIGATGGIGMGGPMGGPMGGMGGGVMGGGIGGPIITPPTPPEVREVVFRSGVVFKADSP